MAGIDIDEDLSSVVSVDTPIDIDESGRDGDENDDTNTQKDEQELERNTLARKENKAVFWARIIVIAVLAITTVVVALIVYMKIHQSEVENFEAYFASASIKVLDSFHQSMEQKLDASDILSIAYTSHALSSNSTFPNVTLPNYHIYASSVRIISDAFVLNYQPFVTDETRDGYEAYVIENRDQFLNGPTTETAYIEYQDAYLNKSISRILQDDESRFSDTIYDLGGNTTPKGSGPYLPVWQTSPNMPYPGKLFVNNDILSYPSAQDYSKTMYDPKAVILAASRAKFSVDDIYFETILSYSQFRDTVTEYLFEPTSPFSYPVFDTFDLATRKVVGLITSTFYWTLYFENILPDNQRGIICVLSNKFNQTFTYRIDGAKATLLGDGDLHDQKYDHLEVYGDMESYLAVRASARTQSYTVVPLNTVFNSYYLRIYPSQDTEDEHLTNEPAIMAVIIICVFVFTSLVFLTYDLLVARRQRIVMNRAVASSAIVSSLFPSEVRDNIYKESEAKLSKKSTTFESRGMFGMRNGESDENIDITISPPNAVLYEETTIMFADMVGFTAWSSTRGPVEVFGLLESIYQAFDRIAQRRKVFKVETIGDCYVAVTGIPNPQPEHAVIMVRFAEECILTMQKVTAKLAETMGPATADLSIRVGLHSGAVTGGVLRGQKSRFQLFGDSMNTAARMESHGKAGQIHISEETANSLTAKGRSHWITPREDKIDAKGKGLLNTFWVLNRKDRETSRTESSAGYAEDSAQQEKTDQTDEEALDIGVTFEV